MQGVAAKDDASYDISPVRSQLNASTFGQQERSNHVGVAGMDSDSTAGRDAAIAIEIDVAHDVARRAYSDRDAAAYMTVFHPELEYVQFDGRTIGRDQLVRDVRDQLARVHTATSEYRRDSMSVESADDVTEFVVQRASFTVRAFGVVRREWSVQRRGRYQWVRTLAGWQIRRVQILSEEVLPVRTWLSFK
jgi:hypothetical protein